MLKGSIKIWIIAVVFISIILAVSVVELGRSYKSLIELVYTEVDLSGYLVSEWIDRSLTGVRSILKDSLHNLDDSNIFASNVDNDERKQRNSSLVHKANQYENIILLGIFDSDCVIQYASIDSIIGDSTKDLERDYYHKVMQKPLEKLKFSDLFVSSTGDVNVSATYPLLSEDGRFIGFALAALNLSFFQKWLDSIDNNAIAISIIDINRTLLARKPESKDIGKPINDKELEAFMNDNIKSTTFRRNSPVDGIERLWSLRKTDEFPFVVAVGYELNDVLLPWRIKLVSYIIGNFLLIVITFFLVLSYLKNRMTAKNMEELAMKDPLTGLMNRRSFNLIARNLFEIAQKNRREDSVLMIDIDHFKRINDVYGHDKGDITLKNVAQLISSNFRLSDPVCRWGGEEFLVYLSGTDLGAAKMLAERLRFTIFTEFSISECSVTVSQGIACVNPEDTYEKMLKKADERLYKAKVGGRNKVCFE